MEKAVTVKSISTGTAMTDPFTGPDQLIVLEVCIFHGVFEYDSGTYLEVSIGNIWRCSP